MRTTHPRTQARACTRTRYDAASARACTVRMRSPRTRANWTAALVGPAACSSHGRRCTMTRTRHSCSRLRWVMRSLRCIIIIMLHVVCCVVTCDARECLFALSHTSSISQRPHRSLLLTLLRPFPLPDTNPRTLHFVPSLVSHPPSLPPILHPTLPLSLALSLTHSSYRPLRHAPSSRPSLICLCTFSVCH